MNTQEIATKADIQAIVNELAELRKSVTSFQPQQKVLRSADVRKLLKISDGTLQRLRITETLPAKKVNGTWFYKYEDVVKMLNEEL